MAIKVNVTKRVKVDGIDRYCPVVFSSNGKIKPGMVMNRNREERHPSGSFYLDWTVAGKRKRMSAGTSASEVLFVRDRKEAELNAVQQGILLAPKELIENKTHLVESVAAFLQEVESTRDPATTKSYCLNMRYFLESCTKPYLEDVKRVDMLAFTAYLRDKKNLSSHTAFTAFTIVVAYLGWTGQKDGVGLRRGDKPKYTAEVPEVFSKDDISKLLAVSSPDRALLWHFFLKTGMRDAEVRHTLWRDVDFQEGTVSVRGKPALNWKPKANRERTIPIPDDLVEMLREARKGQHAGALIFPKADGKPGDSPLHSLKRHATKAGLNPDDFWLHKFRATFCTWHLRAGTDLSTCQRWAGHRTITATMRYLSPLHGSEAKAKVNLAF